MSYSLSESRPSYLRVWVRVRVRVRARVRAGVRVGVNGRVRVVPIVPG